MSFQRIARLICVTLAATMALQAPFAHAGMIGTEEAAAAAPVATADQEREKVKAFLESTALKERLRTLGVDGLSAQARVDAMTQAEVHALATRIDAMPAGGQLSSNDWILILLVALLVIVAL